MRRSRVLALTGIRSEYDLLYPLLRALDGDPAFSLGVIACGAHLTPLHRFSVRQIVADGFRVAARVPNLVASDSAAARVRSIGALISGLAPVLVREKPDLLLVLGDREEALAGAVAANYLGVPVVHLAGGDNTEPKTWDVDEPVRHAITKLSHAHLTMADEHTNRILRMGEQPWRVATVGSGGIDRLRLEPGLGRAELAAKLGPAVLGDYAVLIYHALSSETATAPAEAALCLEEALRGGGHVFVGAPNSDPGGRAIWKGYRKFARDPRVHLYRNLDRRAFAGLLRHARCLVGNSSLALHEAPYLGLPAINVGERQKGRLAGRNVQFVPAKRAAVRRAVLKALSPAYRRTLQPGVSPYGDGRMAEKSLRFLKKLPSKPALLAKRVVP